MENGKYLEELESGMKAGLSKVITDQDIRLFAEISGDHNPIHLNDHFASATPFKKRIAHGLLTASLISAVLGTRLPGPGSIYLSQNIRFKAPVYIGDQVDAEVTISAIDKEKARVGFVTLCRVNNKIVLEGDALLLVPRRANNLQA